MSREGERTSQQPTLRPQNPVGPSTSAPELPAIKLSGVTPGVLNRAGVSAPPEPPPHMLQLARNGMKTLSATALAEYQHIHGNHATIRFVSCFQDEHVTLRRDGQTKTFDTEPIDWDKTRENWDDTTQGLTRSQHHELSLTLRWTSNLQQLAQHGRQPNWDMMKLQCDQLGRDIRNLLVKVDSNDPGASAKRNVSSLVRSTLAPSVPAVDLLSLLIFGAKEPLSKVADVVASRLSGARIDFDGMLKPTKIGTITVSDYGEFDRLIKESQAAPDKRIPGTAIVVTDEARTRRDYGPLTDSQKMSVQEFRAIMTTLEKRARLPDAPLKSILEDLQNFMPSFERMGEEGLNIENRAKFAQLRQELKGVVEMIVGKLAPVDNTLSRIQLSTGEIQQVIQKTLDLPLRHDPTAPGDNVPPARLKGLYPGRPLD